MLYRSHCEKRGHYTIGRSDKSTFLIRFMRQSIGRYNAKAAQ